MQSRYTTRMATKPALMHLQHAGSACEEHCCYPLAIETLVNEKSRCGAHGESGLRDTGKYRS